MELTHESMNIAWLDKNAAYDGLFFVAIKISGNFCRPSCKINESEYLDIEFFPTTKHAILHGYGPCPFCFPLIIPDKTPDSIRAILIDVNENGLSVADADLPEKGIEPREIRNWFKKYHGITFHAYQRMLRINFAFGKIHNPVSAKKKSTISIKETSGVNNATVKLRTSSSQGKRIINMIRLETVLGPMFAFATDEGVCLLEFTDRKMLETEIRYLTKILDATVVNSGNVHFDKLKEQLDEYFSGVRKEFSIPLFTPGTAFQNSVWSALQLIPFGSTRSYKEQASNLGNPDAVRAVAGANGMNRIAIVIPCHRVIGDDGQLKGYGGGLWRKKWLLEHEADVVGKRKYLQQEINFM